MNKTMIAAAVLTASTLTMSASASVVLANWTFETSVPTTAGPHEAEHGLFAASSFASASHASGAVTYSNPVGNGSSESFSSNNWAIGDYYQFTTSTTGYQSITVEWAQTRSGTGPEDFDLQWSTDGVNFTSILSYQVGTTSWSSGTHQPGSVFGPIALSSDLNDQGIIYIRMTATSAPSGAGGTNRIDDIVISGSVIPTPGVLALLGVAGLVGARRRRQN